MRIAYDNYLDAASSLTALTENASYLVANTQNQRLTVVYKSTAVTAQTVTVDLGYARAINTVAVLNHNFTSSVSCIVDMNTTDSWPGATSVTIAYNSDVMLNFFADKTYRFYQFQISDTTNTDGYLKMGRLWLGPYITIDPSSLLGFKVTKKRSDNVFHNQHRQKYANIGVGWRKFDFDFPASNEAMLDKIITMYDAVGHHGSFLFCNFDTDRSYTLVEPCYVSLNDELKFNHENDYMDFSYSLSMEEEL